MQLKTIYFAALLQRSCAVYKEGPLDKVVYLVSRIVLFTALTQKSLLSSHVVLGLDACTYVGLDNDVQTIHKSYFWKCILCCINDITELDVGFSDRVRL